MATKEIIVRKNVMKDIMDMLVKINVNVTRRIANVVIVLKGHVSAYLGIKVKSVLRFVFFFYVFFDRHLSTQIV